MSLHINILFDNKLLGVGVGLVGTKANDMLRFVGIADTVASWVPTDRARLPICWRKFDIVADRIWTKVIVFVKDHNQLYALVSAHSYKV